MSCESLTATTSTVRPGATTVNAVVKRLGDLGLDCIQMATPALRPMLARSGADADAR
jgi:hypothetical protein